MSEDQDTTPPTTPVNPDRRLVRLIDFAVDEILRRLDRQADYESWLTWAFSWRSGDHSPEACVRVGRIYLSKREKPINHCLGQIAWAAKEACYSTPTGGWLVVRYIADAMIAFGVAYPSKPITVFDPPAIETQNLREIAKWPVNP